MVSGPLVVVSIYCQCSATVTARSQYGISRVVHGCTEVSEHSDVRWNCCAQAVPSPRVTPVGGVHFESYASISTKYSRI